MAGRVVLLVRLGLDDPGGQQSAVAEPAHQDPAQEVRPHLG
jgi:hypothetical protein